MLRANVVRWLLALVFLAAVPANAATAVKPTLAYTTPTRIEKVDDPEDTFTGTHISLKYNQSLNRAFISYYDVTHHSLKLAFNPWPQATGTCNGIVGRWVCLTLDGDGLSGHSGDDVGMHSSVDVIQVSTGISYYDKTHGALKFARYDCFFVCTLTIETIEIGAGLDAGGYGTGMAFTQAGVPYIAYSYSDQANHANDALKLAHGVNSGGNCGAGAYFGKWQCDVIDRGNGAGRSPSINLYENPGLTVQIAYLKSGNVLMFAFNDPHGEECAPATASYWTCYIIDQHGGGDVSLRSFNTIPSIAYYDSAGGNLRYAAYLGPVPDANCGIKTGSQNLWRCDPIEAVGSGLPRTSVSLSFDGSGYPAIVYKNSPSIGPATLKIARPLNAYNYDVGNCGPVPSGGFMPTWLCSMVDSGGANTDEAAFAAIGLRSNGLAIIAFTEDDTYHDTQRLMVAMQQVIAYIPAVRK